MWYSMEITAVLMYKKQGDEFFSKKVTETVIKKYFNDLCTNKRSLLIPIINDGEKNHYYFEPPENNSKSATLRVFLTLNDMRYYVQSQTAGSGLTSSDFNVLEADQKALYECAEDITSSGMDIGNTLQCVVCSYVLGSLVEFDMFWCNDRTFSN